MIPRILSLLFVFAFAAAAHAQQVGAWGFDLPGMDRSVKPGDDFFRYAAGNWVATTKIPGDKPRYTTFDMLRDRSEARVHEIVKRWAADKNLKPGSDEAKVAALYRTYLDEATIEKLGTKPIEPNLERIRKAKTHADIAKLMARSYWDYGRTFMRVAVFDDEKNPDQNTLHLFQGGLGLPDRDFYLRENFKPRKERYQQYVAEMLRLAGWPEPEKNAAAVVALETKIAEGHWTRTESRDRDKRYNPMTFAELEREAPGFPWAVYFKELGVEKAGRAVLVQKSAFPKIATAFADAPLETLQAWMAFHTVDNAAALLPKRFEDASFEFRQKFLNGVQEKRPRWKGAVQEAETAMGEAIGRAYVAEHFPPESKAAMEKLVANLMLAMKGRIERAQWMGPETRAKALEKLAKFRVKIGYPSKWQDYSKLVVREGDAIGNGARMSKFFWDDQVARLWKKVDDEEWGMTPQTVNAYYAAVKNEIVFPAALLQAPFFDPKADPAMNYGAIGGGIGHEITHAFDDQGRKSDGNGVLRDWWAPEDAAKFEAQAAKLAAQYEALPLRDAPGAKMNGKLTLGENIADLGGILLALDGWKISLGGKPAPVLDGFTGEQRVFLAWTQKWRALYREEALRQQVVSDPHAPGDVRASAPLRNVDAWYEAFGVREGDAMYIRPEDRVRIW